MYLKKTQISKCQWSRTVAPNLRSTLSPSQDLHTTLRGSCFQGYKVLEKGNNFQVKLRSRHVCLNLASHFRDPQFFPVLTSMPDCGTTGEDGANNNSQKSGTVLPSGPKRTTDSRAILKLD